MEGLVVGIFDVARAIEFLDLSVKSMLVDKAYAFRIFLFTVKQSLDDRRKDFYRIMLRVWFNLYVLVVVVFVVPSVV
jgi:hypothetical protein